MADSSSPALSGSVVVGAAAPPTDALADFIRRHDAELRRYLRSRIRHEEDAADLRQECYARLLRHVHAHPQVVLEPPLLFRIANNLLTDSWRRSRLYPVESDGPQDAANLVDTGAAPDRVADEQQILARLREVVRNLPARRQEVFVCSRWLGMSNAEIAVNLGISVKAVEKHITKALAACRAEVGDVALERYS